MIVNRIRFSGTVTDQFNNKIDGAKIVWSDSKGIPKKHEDKPVGTYSNEFGEWGLQIPSQYFHSESSNFITARSTGQPDEIVEIRHDNYKNIDLILGAKTQEEDEVFVVACRSLKCKIKRSFAKNKKAYIYGVIGLILLAVAMTLVFSSKRTS
jgi:hypothetical protein